MLQQKIAFKPQNSSSSFYSKFKNYFLNFTDFFENFIFFEKKRKIIISQQFPEKNFCSFFC